MELSWGNLRISILYYIDYNSGYPGYFVDTLFGSNRINCNSKSIGISSAVYISSLLHFESKKILKHLEFTANLKAGVGFIQFENRSYLAFQKNPDNGAYSKRINATSTNFNGKMELALGYRTKGSFFSVVGAKIGYQTIKTNQLDFYSSGELEYYTNPNFKKLSLDFSGIYYGIYVKIGKS